jgi:hypothetical protein
MAPGQDWCTHCGAGAPGSVDMHTWRPWALALTATIALVLVAAAAGYAALTKKPKHAGVKTATVAQAPPPAVTPPPATTPTPTPPAVTTKPPKIAKVPKIPTTALTPPATTPSTPVTGGGTGEQNTSPTGTGGSGTEAKPAPILLDTNAAATYNPYSYPAAGFGDPSLTIDGDPGTGWSAQVNPATAPRMAEGVVIDLKSTNKLVTVKLITTTPGMTLQVYGAKTDTLPSSITDPAWVPLSRSVTIKKRHAKIGLRNKGKAYRFVAVWISGAPAASIGTPEKPGKVTLNEIELFPAG